MRQQKVGTTQQTFDWSFTTKKLCSTVAASFSWFRREFYNTAVEEIYLALQSLISREKIKTSCYAFCSRPVSFCFCLLGCSISQKGHLNHLSQYHVVQWNRLNQWFPIYNSWYSQLVFIFIVVYKVSLTISWWRSGYFLPAFG